MMDKHRQTGEDDIIIAFGVGAVIGFLAGRCDR